AIELTTPRVWGGVPEILERQMYFGTKYSIFSRYDKGWPYTAARSVTHGTAPLKFLIVSSDK
ncbi:hypothetical protein SK128_015154, partial [Halocaridina rubra]